MRTFQDAATPTAREWRIDVDVDVLSRVADAAECNLLAILDDDDPVAKRFATDPVFAAKLIWLTVQPLAESRGIDAADFRRSLKGDAFRDAANALVLGCSDFFATPQRNALHKILGVKREIEERLTARMLRDAEEVDPKLVAEAFVEVMGAMGGRLATADPDAVAAELKASLQAKRSASAGN